MAGATRTTSSGYIAEIGITSEALPPAAIAAISVQAPRPLNTPFNSAQPRAADNGPYQGALRGNEGGGQFLHHAQGAPEDQCEKREPQPGSVHGAYREKITIAAIANNIPTDWRAEIRSRRNRTASTTENIGYSDVAVVTTAVLEPPR
jgi:hypothetical protein